MIYRIPADRERFNPPPARLSPSRAFRFGVRMHRGPWFVATLAIGSTITTALRYVLGWREYDLKVAALNGAVLAVVMFLIDMARGYRRAFCVRAGIRKGAAK